jgi:hypothetical protein
LFNPRHFFFQQLLFHKEFLFTVDFSLNILHSSETKSKS